MQVSVTYAEPVHQYWIRIDLPEGATIRDALERSSLLARFPEIDLRYQKVGIFGKVTPLETTLSEGDRVEIYRPITADPETVPRKNDC